VLHRGLERDSGSHKFSWKLKAEFAKLLSIPPNNLSTSRQLVPFSSPVFPLPPTKTNSNSTCRRTFAYGHSASWGPGHTEHVERSLGERERPISLISRNLNRKPKHSVPKDPLRAQSRQLSLWAFVCRWEHNDFLRCQELAAGFYPFASPGNKCLTNSQHVRLCLPTTAGSTNCFSLSALRAVSTSINIFNIFLQLTDVWNQL